MSRYVFKMPDLGEGTVSAEVVAWHVKPGDLVQEDQVMCEVMTEKAAVEMPAPVTGRILSIQGEPGDMVAVGSELVVFDTDATSAAAGDAPAAKTPPPAPTEPLTPQRRSTDKAPGQQQAPEKQANEKQQIAAAANGAQGNGENKSSRVMVSPASRRRAAEAGLDLSTVTGTGPAGRIEPGDIDSALAAGAARGAPPSMNARANAAHAPRNGTEEVKIIGLRRVIAERLTESARSIPQYSYVEECDLTRLEGLRKHLNDRRPPAAPPLTFLPFIVAALARVLDKFPQCNALYDSARGVLVKHKAVHVGIATQTPQGLKVPVVRNVESRALHDLAAEIRRVAEAARTNKSPREELTGSTITITSLGKLGGIASTPMINMPEVSIIGINKAIERAVVVDGQICVRLMMNLSSSFDHRFVDGFDAASMIQALKDSLEQPATIFID
ncbi:MAG TPA: dihydrolipoamide acetyltransferase family protein [Steroidobacteraceae bacterium]|nr:dihydrolipoamide acetyltransferase family protein [Steroidobacteraceae bacterium]